MPSAWGGSVGDQLIGKFLTESLMPTLLHEDPRYFRRGRGGVWSRIGYSASRVLIARNDQGNWTFNFAEVGGNAIGAAIGNAHYPENGDWETTSSASLLRWRRIRFLKS